MRNEVQLTRVMKNNRRGTLNDLTKDLTTEKTLLFVLRLSGENYYFKWVTTDGYTQKDGRQRM